MSPTSWLEALHGCRRHAAAARGTGSEAPAALLFAMRAGERHESGAPVAALIAARAGADAVYLGAELLTP